MFKIIVTCQVPIEELDPETSDGLDVANTWNRLFPEKKPQSYSTIKTKKKITTADGQTEYVDQRLFKCRMCPFSTTEYVEITHHEHKNVPTETNICLYCHYVEYRGRGFIRSHIEKSHLEISPYICRFCYHLELNDDRMKSHIQSEHKDMIAEDLAHLHYRKPIIGLSQSAWSYYWKPLPSYLFEVPDQYLFNDHVVLKRGNSKKYFCKFCNFQTRELNTIIGHGQTLHKNSRPMLLACGKCCQCFTLTINPEELSHTSCPTCLNTEYMSDMGLLIKCLQEDNFEHSDGQFIYSCQICEQLIDNRRIRLDTHMKRHCPYRPYTCPYCTYSWVTQEAVQIHIAGEHSDKSNYVNVDSRVLRQYNSFIKSNSVKLCVKSGDALGSSIKTSLSDQTQNNQKG